MRKSVHHKLKICIELNFDVSSLFQKSLEDKHYLNSTSIQVRKIKRGSVKTTCDIIKQGRLNQKLCLFMKLEKTLRNTVDIDNIT